METTNGQDGIEIAGEVPTNGAKDSIELVTPYMVEFELEGTSMMLFHRWNVEAIEDKAGSAKGSQIKKTDNVESYVWRNDKQEICVPYEYVRMSMVNAAKFKQDPRSPRKSAMDLFRAGIVPDGELATLGIKTWDVMDTRRAVVQRNGINRSRPAVKTGWKATFQFTVTLPEYIRPELFRDVLQLAGRVVGLADFRPTYGRFVVNNFDVMSLT